MAIAESSLNVPPAAAERSTQAPASSTSPSLAETAISPEIYRKLYVSLDLPVDRGPVVGITSSISGEGRTTVALGLAHTLATDLDTEVLLVDADFVRPSLAGRLGFEASPGLPDVLRGEARLADVTRQMSERLFVVTNDAGADGMRLLRQLAGQDPFASSRARGVVMILDLPPILNHSYSALAASAADALVLVIRAGVTPADTVRDAVKRLKDRPPQGVVLNGERSARPSRQGSAPDGERPARPSRRLGRRR
ncbi:MAG: hypothetical protein JOZ41_12565 [Chloroflexi bacterium]|nr:hypothetical protein [Chloroflexota bacterium]